MLVPEGSDNEFYQITDERINFHFNDEIMIGGKTCKILKVMACNTSWLLRFYYNPLKNIMSLVEKPLPPSPPKPIYIPIPTYIPKPDYKPKPTYATNQTNITNQNYTPKPTYKAKHKEDDCCC